MNEIQNAVYKLGTLLMTTGITLRQMSKREPTLKDLDDIRETLTYCSEAVSKISDSLPQGDSREKHGL